MAYSKACPLIKARDLAMSKGIQKNQFQQRTGYLSKLFLLIIQWYLMVYNRSL